MCMEDIRIGRHTSDTTQSVREEVPTDTDPQELVIPPNQFRVGLRLYGGVTAIVDNEAEATFESGAVEVWVDSPPAIGSVGSEFQRLLLVLTEHNPTELLRIETEGLLLQRRMTLRPVRPVKPGTLSDFITTMSFTQYIMPEDTKYDWKPSDGPTHSYR